MCLDEDFLTDAYFPEIMQQGGVTNLLYVLAAETQITIRAHLGLIHGLGQTYRQLCDPLRMPEGRRIPKLDRFYRGANKSFEKPLDITVKQIVFERDRCLSRQRARQLLAPLGKRDHLLANLFRGGQAGSPPPLGIDQLDDSDNFILLVFHGNDQNGLGSVAELLVEFSIKGERATPNPVGVADIDDFSGAGRVPGEAAGVEGHREFPKRNGDAVVLSQLEDQMPCPFSFFASHQIKRSGIGVGDLTALVQDQFQQGICIVLGGERQADSVQGPQLRSSLDQFLAGTGPLSDLAQGFEGGGQRFFKNRHTCRLGQEGKR